MQLKFLKQIVEEAIGSPAEELVNLLSEKKDINEFLIAKRLKLTINQTRNILYKLSHFGILSSIRKKDKRKGWYIYFWTLDTFRSLEILRAKMQAEIEKLKHEFSTKQIQRFYKCPICGIERSEEEALITDFLCTECGEVYVLSDNVQHLQAISKKIIKLTKNLELIDGEMRVEQEKLDKKLAKTIKKVQKDKKDKRLKNAIIRKKLRQKLERDNKKAGKKTSPLSKKITNEKKKKR